MDRRSTAKTKPGCVYLFLALLLLSPLACADSREEARARLDGLGLSYSAEAFVEVAAAGDLQAVRHFLDAGMDPNARNEQGATPLTAAAGRGRGPVVELLLERGADVNAQSQEKGIIKRRRARLRKKIKQYPGSPLMHAARNGHAGVVLLLLEKGADLEARDAKEGRTALLWAVSHSRNAAFEILLDKGASPGAADKRGHNASMTAVLYARPDTMILVLNRLGPQGRKDAERPLLHLAAAAGRTDNLKLLLARGEDVNARDPNGRTALMWAAGAGKKESVRLLLESGADPGAQDREGKKALDLAKDDQALMDLLFRAESLKPDSSRK